MSQKCRSPVFLKGLIVVGLFAFLPLAICRFADCQPAKSVASPDCKSWLMKGHDTRRTGHSPVPGPGRGDQVWTFKANDAHLINMEPSVSSDGVFFGSWGLIRKQGAKKSGSAGYQPASQSKQFWDKFDGKVYGLDLADGKPLWQPQKLDHVPYAYRYDQRPATMQDQPAGRGLHLNFFNGTVEGTAAIDEVKKVLYFGRGDAALYALDAVTGKQLFRFLTFDPPRPADPEGGGEIVGGPLLSGNDLFFATFAAPTAVNPPRQICHETNAVYCIDTNGRLRWRYPAAGGFANPFSAALALSSDGQRLYAATQTADLRRGCELLCLDAGSGKPFWTLPLPNLGANDLALGVDGVVYMAGTQKKGLRVAAAVFAVADIGRQGRLLWVTDTAGDGRAKNLFAGGLALVESESKVTEILASTSNLRSILGPGPTGRLYAITPETGAIRASFNPELADPACLGSLTDVSTGGDGLIYVGVHGGRAGRRKESGKMYCLKRKQAGFEQVWTKPVEGELDWNCPAIGPDGGLYYGSTAVMPVLSEISPHRIDEDVADADPFFYGIHD